MEVAKNHPPIINEVIRTGETFETKESPIGERNNSPMVTTPYEPINHQADALSDVISVFQTANAITKVDNPVINNPYPIFAGVLGSAFLFRKNEKKSINNRSSRFFRFAFV